MPLSGFSVVSQWAVDSISVISVQCEGMIDCGTHVNQDLQINKR